MSAQVFTEHEKATAAAIANRLRAQRMAHEAITVETFQEETMTAQTAVPTTTYVGIIDNAGIQQFDPQTMSVDTEPSMELIRLVPSGDVLCVQVAAVWRDNECIGWTYLRSTDPLHHSEWDEPESHDVRIGWEHFDWQFDNEDADRLNAAALSGGIDEIATTG